jgi:hypothetical protein
MWNYFRSAFFNDLDEATAHALVESYSRVPNGLSELHIHHLGGAMGRVFRLNQNIRPSAGPAGHG